MQLVTQSSGQVVTSSFATCLSEKALNWLGSSLAKGIGSLTA